ncbi:MAG: biotin--[acetyl-CoA-carboxylase] ligase [Saprospiraceae bacterium]
MDFDFPYLYLPETESTNQLAIDMISKTNPADGFMLITDYQTAGRGQYGRIWQSKAGKNLLVSFIFYPKNIPINKLFRLNLAASLAIIRCLKTFDIAELSIKWPNDIYIQNQKIAGILIQNILKASEIQAAVIGIGLNVNQEYFSTELSASSLQNILGKEMDIKKIASDIRAQLLTLLKTRSTEDWSLLLAEYNEVLYKKNKKHVFNTAAINPMLASIQYVTEDGKIHLLTENQEIISFTFGELNYK